MNTQTGRTWATRTPGGVVVVCASEAEARWMHRSPTWTSVDLLVRERPGESWRTVRKAVTK